MTAARLATVARYAGTVAMAGLLAAYQYYPGAKWILVALLTLGILGFHVVPTAAQVTLMRAGPSDAHEPPVTAGKPPSDAPAGPG